MAHGKPSPLLSLILFFAALTGVVGLTSKDIQSWDEGVYYTEARFVVQSARVAILYGVGKVLPHAGIPDLATLKHSVTGLAPQMGRPVNVAINSVGLAILGQHAWVPALLSVLEGLGCIYLVFLILRREVGERAGLLGALLLTLSPYFLPYRRLGVCEAAGAVLALATVYALLRWWEEGAALARRHSWWLGVLCGLSFGANTRTLLLLPPVLLWRMWGLRRTSEAGWRDQWWAHGARVALGFALMVVLYQLPYIVIGPLGAKLGSGAVEDYIAQLGRFVAAQKQLGRLGLAEAYGAPAYFFWRNERPTVLLFALGLGWLVWGRGRREGGGPGGPPCAEAGRPWVVASLLVLPLLQTAVLVPYARYQSWLLPVFAMIAGLGLWGLWQWGEKHRAGLGRGLVVAALVVVTAHAAYRGVPVLQARSLHPAALQWCHAHRATALVDTNMSAALGSAPLYRLDRLWQMPLETREASAAIKRMDATGKALVIVETQQFMKAELLLSPEEYERTAAAILRKHATPLWQQDGHLAGLFPFLCFEHNRHLQGTLQTLERYQPVAAQIAVYDAQTALRALQQFPPSTSTGMPQTP